MNKIRIQIFLILLLATSFSACHYEQSAEKDAALQQKINVAVYAGSGASGVCVTETLEALKIDPGISARPISPAQIQQGGLNDLDVLVFPGGSGSKEYNSLGRKNDDLVRDFAAKKGKGIVGICAGGYLFATTEGYPSLKIIHAETIREHYNRGRGLIGFSLNETGEKIFPELSGEDTLFVQYYDGPIYNILDSSKISVNATITSDIATHQNDPLGVTPGKPAFLTAPFGNGKVFVSVGHPESTPGMRWMVPRMVRWVCERPFISYPTAVVRPNINNHEILYYADIIKFEKANFWNLFSDNEQEIVEAIDKLYSIRSRPSIRWSIGLLRHPSPLIRKKALEYLRETEYTDAIPDIESAYLTENEAQLKLQMEEVLSFMKTLVHQAR